MSKTSLLLARAAVLSLGVAAMSVPALAEARGGGGMRASAPTSISGAGRANAGAVNRGNVNRGAVNTGNVNRGNVNTGNVNRGNVNTGNINRGNINVGNDVNINVDRSYNNGWHDWDDRYYPVARGVAFGTAAAVSAAAVGSMIYSLPPACVATPYRGYTYYSCNGVWYQPRYQGTTVTYVVVTKPY
ncbi:pentapeptide repeat-containing protein [Phenylobacterium terrae]|uniref:Pentapeptide repeat-containing protein n=1 Tax=Phenylobacterium terrae TaxID=2665495 RepID=A0ABW4N4S2_9CAUL